MAEPQPGAEPPRSQPDAAPAPVASPPPTQVGTTLAPGLILKGRWKLVKKIGQGAFGEIFACIDLERNESVAIKLEKWDNKKAVLKLEVAVLKKLQGSSFVCRYIHCGHYEDYNYLVMELLGENLSDLRRRQMSGRFSLATTARLGVQMLRAIQAIHELGYLHRDIKPSNFAMGLAQTNRNKDCVMIDFGLTRKFKLQDGSIRPPREIAGFRGTARYASINSHLSKELSRRDDLWSLLFVLIEFTSGQLPWRKLKDKEEIGLQKIQFNSPELVRDMPSVFLPFMEHLQALDYDETPNYDMLAELLNQLDSNATASVPSFDWEMEQPQPARPVAIESQPSEEDDDVRRGFSSDRVPAALTQGDVLDSAFGVTPEHGQSSRRTTRTQGSRAGAGSMSGMVSQPAGGAAGTGSRRYQDSQATRALDFDGQGGGVPMQPLAPTHGAGNPSSFSSILPTDVQASSPDAKPPAPARKSCFGKCSVM